MNTMRTSVLRAGALALCLFGAGCGLFGGAKKAADTDLASSAAFLAVARIGDIYDLYSVIPNQGPLAGGTHVELRGVFPDPQTPAELNAALQTYSVFFGANLAPYDTSVPQVITGGSIYVIAPPGDFPGLVDVAVRDMPRDHNAATLNAGYEYLDPFAIIAVDPDAGPMPGGQQVTITGRFPIAAPIMTIAEAYSAYQAYFDGRPAGFDSSFSPVITADAMYVITPAGVPPNAPGLVDVSVGTVVSPSETPEFRVLPLGYEYIETSFALYSVDPNRGHICGGEPVTLHGAFPVSAAFSASLLGNLAGASQYYSVYFGGRLAVFDPSVPTPVITGSEMHVLAPYGDDVGFVDVSVVSHDGDDYSNSIVVQLDQAFRYYAMYLARVVPPLGPLAGNNVVRLEGFLPGLAAISNIYAAEAAYSVYFGGKQAAFANMAPGVVFQPSVIIDMASCMYTTGYMYVIVPPGDALGLVDVTIQDDTGKDLPTTAVDGYEYVGGGGISAWNVASVCPNPVGKLESGQLVVTIEGTGQMDSRSSVNNPVFIVPQGGNPGNVNDRILLREISYSEGSGGFAWIGTNIAAIPRIMNPGLTNELLVDGHAAVYIDLGGGLILGDDATDATDGGVIQLSAQQGRHFLIDTIPPRMLILPNATRLANVLRGDDFVSMDIPGNWTLADLDSVAGPQAFPHPFVVGPLPSDPYDAPYDGHWMFRPAGLDTMAQVFFKVSSVTNNFADSAVTPNLQFTVNVTFEDVDIYTMLNRARGPRDADFFGGSMDRQVAGFENGLNLSVSGLVRDEAFVNGSTALQDLLIQWDFQPTPFGLPDITGITVQYVTGGPMSFGAPSGLSTNLDSTPTELQGIFTLGDGSAATGVQVGAAGLRNLMSVVFRAVDRAGDNFRLCNLAIPHGKLYTRDDTSTLEGYAADQQPEMGPLNLWWLRTTATRLTSTIPPSGDIIAPSFSWQNTGVPDPGAYPDTDDGTGTERRYSYAIYRTDASLGTRDEQRDGPYTLVGSLTDAFGGGGAGRWSGWNAVSSLTPAEVQQIIASDGGATEGVWFLLVVISADEAGNIELWPETQLVNPAGAGPLTIASVVETTTEERNWERWFVPPSGEAVDTRVEPFFWHDGDAFNGLREPAEPSFGDAEVIPLPSAQTFNPLAGVLLQRVTGQFRITLITDQTLAGVQYELFENGVSKTGLVDVAPNLIAGRTFTAVIYDATDLTSFLGSDTRKPTYYTFRARTFVDTNGNGTLDAGEIYDASPATVQFVVVDNVAYFIQNRRSVDTQPIQEMDRP